MECLGIDTVDDVVGRSHVEGSVWDVVGRRDVGRSTLTRELRLTKAVM